MVMMMTEFRHAPPRASAMIEALRGLGYTTATALADIIDNSISAGADLVELTFIWNGAESVIIITDNGSGMDAHGLDLAMRLGERSPLDERHLTDLGRFGLGLKTASFSQCRRLTVASRKKEGSIECLRWDLDVLAASKDDGWHLLVGAHPASRQHLSSLDELSSGTAVLWEKLDRIVTPGFREQDYLDLIDTIEQHLAMVFHRYLHGRPPRLTLRINGKPIAPWDPFLANHAASWSSPVERIDSVGGVVKVQCHVLPHQDRLTTHEYERAAGPDGWAAQQGFYVYRNERLLVAGSWLGLGRGRSWSKEEAHRLARICLDIPNTADSAWKIDIRKSTARPPVALRDRLTSLATDARARARRVFAHRGQAVRVSGRGAVTQAWRAEHFKGGMRYRLDIEHPAIKTVLEDAGPMTAQIRAMLRVIEETIPVQRIWLDTTEAHETPRTGFAGETSTEVLSVLNVFYTNLVDLKGMSPSLAREQLLNMEPFNAYPELVAQLPDKPNKPV